LQEEVVERVLLGLVWRAGGGEGTNCAERRNQKLPRAPELHGVEEKAWLPKRQLSSA